ncbi:MAG: phosphate signaling complex protein PhoU [Planctomycetes bacterium]|nr:phosphate signaling complex protein PhoU [Planctomycetota bacterium]
MIRHFDEQLDELRRRLVLMGSFAEAMIRLAVRALVERDETHSAEVFRKEEEVNELQIEVDDRAIKLTALQQPVASDVRFLFMSSRIATELERIADQAVNVCQNVHHALLAPPLRPIIDLPLMADIAERMVRESLESLTRRDVGLAEHVLEEERKVDAYKEKIFRELLTYMMADPGTIPRALALILISRNLERVADHATNVAEEVIFLVQGRDIRHRHDEKLRGAEGAEGSGGGGGSVGK